MKRIVILATLFLLLSGIAYAACTDSDNGPNYAEKGYTKIISGKEDICIISASAEVRTDESQHLKEYFCDNNDQIDYDIIDCVREGFAGCEFGECVGGTAGAKAQDSNYTPPAPVPYCGDSIVDPGEDCDPMNKMCFDDDGNIGLCNAECLCEIKITKDGSKADSSDTVDSSDSSDNSDTQDDSANIEIDTPVEVDTAPEPAPVVVSGDDSKDNQITVTIAEKPKKEEPKGFFSRIWAWIAGLFS